MSCDCKHKHLFPTSGFETPRLSSREYHLGPLLSHSLWLHSGLNLIGIYKHLSSVYHSVLSLYSFLTTSTSRIVYICHKFIIKCSVYLKSFIFSSSVSTWGAFHAGSHVGLWPVGTLFWRSLTPGRPGAPASAEPAPVRWGWVPSGHRLGCLSAWSATH